MSTFSDMINKDIELIREIQNYCYHTPRLSNFMARIVSKKPFYDIVIILYVFFFLGLYDVGVNHFWLVALNLSVIFC